MNEAIKVKISKNGKALYYRYSVKAMRAFRISRKEADDLFANGAERVEKFFYEA